MENNDAWGGNELNPSTEQTPLADGASQTRAELKSKRKPEASHKLNTKFIIAAVAAIVVIAVAVVVIILLSTGSIGSSGLAARVNGDPVTTKQLDAAVAKLKIANPQIFTANSGISTAQIRSTLLDELVNERLIMQEAKNRGVSVTDAQVNQQVDAIKKQYSSASQFNAILQQQGYTLESLKTQLQYQLAAQGIAKKLVPENSISAKDIQTYYDEHKGDFIVAAGKQVSQIKFALSDPAKAADVLKQLKGGASFTTLAQKNSADAVSAARGGDLGWTPMTPPLDKTLQEAVNKLGKGEISDVIKSSAGLFILKVTNTREASAQSLDEAKTTIQATLLNTKRNGASQNLLTELRKKAKITVYDKVVKDYQTQKNSSTTSGSASGATGKNSSTPKSGSSTSK